MLLHNYLFLIVITFGLKSVGYCISTSGFFILKKLAVKYCRRTNVRTLGMLVRKLRTYVRAPHTNVRTPRINVRALRTNIRTPRTNIRAPRTNIRAPDTNVRRARTYIRGARMYTLISNTFKYQAFTINQ